MRYPRLRYANREGFQVASDAVVMCFYLPCDHKRAAPAVMSALELFRENARPFQLDWYIDPEGYSHVLDRAGWENIRQQVLGPEEGAMFRLSGGPERVGGTYVDYRGLSSYPLPWPGRERDVGALFLRLPTEYLEAHGATQVRELALELAEKLPFSSGYVDLVFCELGPTSAASVRLRTRYPGLHMTREGPDIRVGTQVDGIHWMNFLGQPVLGQLGGVSALRERLNLPGISIQELSGDRALITLGDQPNPGDVEAGETLPLHRALARVLEPHLYTRTRTLGRMTPEDMRRWERRFLD